MFLKHDVEGQGINKADEECREAPSWLCYMAYAYMQKGHREVQNLYWVLIMRAICTHLDEADGT